MLENGRAGKEGRNLDGTKRRDFRAHDRGLREDHFDWRVPLFVLTRGNQGDGAFMARSGSVSVKAFMQLRRDREAESKKERRNQPVRHDGLETLATIHGGRRMELSRGLGKSFSGPGRNLENRMAADLAQQKSDLANRAGILAK